MIVDDDHSRTGAADGGFKDLGDAHNAAVDRSLIDHLLRHRIGGRLSLAEATPFRFFQLDLNIISWRVFALLFFGVLVSEAGVYFHHL
jgi:hypothetical protein